MITLKPTEAQTLKDTISKYLKDTHLPLHDLCLIVYLISKAVGSSGVEIIFKNREIRREDKTPYVLSKTLENTIEFLFKKENLISSICRHIGFNAYYSESIPGNDCVISFKADGVDDSEVIDTTEIFYKEVTSVIEFAQRFEKKQ